MNTFKPPVFSQDDVIRNHETFRQRLSFFLSAGIDQVGLRENILQLIPEQYEKVLEVGTGNGCLTTMLAARFPGLTSTDIDPDGLGIAALNLAYTHALDKVTLLQEDALSLPFPDKSFDLVISAYAFHHFEKPFAVLSEMIRVTRQTLLIADFSEQGFSRLDAAHARENKKHERQHGDFYIVGSFLKYKGFYVEKVEEPLQVIYKAVKL